VALFLVERTSLRDAGAILVTDPELVLRVQIVLIGGLPVPLGGLRHVVFLLVMEPEIILRLRQALFGVFSDRIDVARGGRAGPAVDGHGKGDKRTGGEKN